MAAESHGLARKRAGHGLRSNIFRTAPPLDLHPLAPSLGHMRHRARSILGAACSAAAFASLASGPGVAQGAGLAEAQAFKRPASIPAPAGNPLTRAKIDLGRRLFSDPFLSQSGTRACASCHSPIQAFTDGLPKARAFGHALQRNTPGLWNLAWRTSLFWDGRAASLEAQARVPLTAPEEMGRSLEEAAARIAARPGYAAEFAAAFPADPAITPDNLARALASYERSLVSPQTRFDAFAGGRADALSALERRGFALFTGPAGCAACHSGFAFTDDGFHKLVDAGADLGRGAVTGARQDVGAFRTPSLRELNTSAPYLHDGSAPTLAEAIAAHGAASLSADDSAALIAFLLTLSSPGAPAAAPPLDAAGALVTHVSPD